LRSVGFALYANLMKLDIFKLYRDGALKSSICLEDLVYVLAETILFKNGFQILMYNKDHFKVNN
jgi:hypothetical protein